jgi:hypothetical protein
MLQSLSRSQNNVRILACAIAIRFRDVPENRSDEHYEWYVQRKPGAGFRAVDCIGLVGIGSNWRDNNKNRSNKAGNERGQTMEETHLFRGRCARGDCERRSSRNDVKTGPIIGPSGTVARSAYRNPLGRARPRVLVVI